MKRLIRQLKWPEIVVGVLLIIGCVTVVWAGNVSTNIEDTGTNVGIGTTSPQMKLDVSGRIRSITGEVFSGILGINASFRLIGTNNWDMFHDDTADKLHIRRNSVEYLSIVPGGNVGVGTMSPANILEVRSGRNSDRLRIVNTNTTGGTATLTLEQTAASTKNWAFVTNFSVLGSLELRQSNSSGGDPYSAGTSHFIINNSGNVGIGTTGPVTKLHVAGDAQVDGNLAAKYQDVAEWVKAPGSLPHGTVVVIDPYRHDHILPASQSYDTRVAGVVSARPGLLLGEAGEGKVKVAQSGRVKVKVDAAYGSIAVGDLLVTSPTPGHAMRSSPVKLGDTLIHRPGTLLGKALEPLEEGQGDILVLLTLQ